MNTLGTDKGVTIRYPATANLMIDSADRDESRNISPWNFQINKKQALQNGFMTRCATTEVVLEWYQPNITDSNNTLSVDISGATTRAVYPITLPVGFYTVAEALNEMVVLLNDLSGTTAVSFAINPLRSNNSEYELLATGGEFNFAATSLSIQLGLYTGAPTLVPSWPLYYTIDLRPYRYIDFVSAQLTYNQDLKDNSTAALERDVLCRWYMAFDDAAVTNDAYGFPILMGYFPFVLRRLFNPPKQIRWDPAQSIGNLSFEVYGSDGVLVSPLDYPQSAAPSNWLMTLQLTEN